MANEDFRSSGKRFIEFNEFVDFLYAWNYDDNNTSGTPSLGMSFCKQYGITDDIELNLPNTHTHQAVRIILARYVEDK